MYADNACPLSIQQLLLLFLATASSVLIQTVWFALATMSVKHVMEHNFRLLLTMVYVFNALLIV